MMNLVRKYLFISIVICCFTFSDQINNVDGKTNDANKIEEFIYLNDNIQAEKAIEMYEKKHNIIVQLPDELPFKPTHQFGQLTNQGDLKLHFMRLFNKPHQDIILIILSPERNIETFLAPEDDVITMPDHSKAYIKTIDNYFNLLFFQKNDIGYVVGGNTKHIPKLNLDGLINIAESINE